ncbi:MAG: hypothetical protein P4L92_14475 [Rudaea sp.]|nr:hypothetical protein [Rudaea sp.]
MNNELPVERQLVLVTLDNRDWQPATFRYGQFVDAYGLPLDSEKISNWRPVDGSGANAVE